MKIGIIGFGFVGKAVDYGFDGKIFYTIHPPLEESQSILQWLEVKNIFTRFRVFKIIVLIILIMKRT